MPQKILVITVGQGNLDQLETTLFTPLRKSIAKGTWHRILLLPSQSTAPLAQQLAGEDPVFSLLPLSKAGDEDDADVCFGRYEGILSELLQVGVRRQDLTIDFTRGTKAMSAAIVLAAVTHDVPNLRYVTGKRNRNGVVIPGAEEVRDLSTRIAGTRRNLALALHHIERHQFSAAASLFPENGARWLAAYPESCQADVEWTRWAALFWGAWDRFDYQRAQHHLSAMPVTRSRSLSLWIPSAAQKKYLTRLAAGRAGVASPSNVVRDLAADLIANGERQVASGAFEDTLLRSYRALEMMGQARLFDRGLDSENLDSSQAQVKGWLADHTARGYGLPARRQLQLNREQTLSLLQYLGDEFASELAGAAQSGAWDRNGSLLIHGFKATSDGKKCRQILAVVRETFALEHKKNAERLETAAFPSRRAEG